MGSNASSLATPLCALEKGKKKVSPMHVLGEEPRAKEQDREQQVYLCMPCSALFLVDPCSQTSKQAHLNDFIPLRKLQ